MTINNLKLYKDVEITTKYGHFLRWGRIVSEKTDHLAILVLIKIN